MVRYPSKFGTHLPVLMSLIGRTEGRVLELGTGVYSTPYLHWACVPKHRTVFSYENDPRYYDFAAQFQDDYHQVFFVEDWDKISIETLEWDVVLIDHGPRERRIVDIARLANCAKYIVVHDTYWKTDRHYHYSQIYPSFRWRYDYTAYKPYSTILSNFIDLTGFQI